MVSKDELVLSIGMFVAEHKRYPSKKECKDINYLFGYNTYTRHLGYQEDWGILESSYEEFPATCNYCKSDLLFEKRFNKFCNRSCAATENNTLRSKSQYDFCRCGESLGRRSSTFCSRKCFQRFTYEDSLKSWTETGEKKSNRVLRRYLTDMRGYKCECCGISEWNGLKITLEVDHIDGDNTDCSPVNVRLICPNCHSQTDTYKALNKGNGRVGRMKRYRAGKTY